MKYRMLYYERPDWELGILTGFFGFLIGILLFMASSAFGGLLNHSLIFGALSQGIIIGISGFLFGSFNEYKKIELKEEVKK